MGKQHDTTSENETSAVDPKQMLYGFSARAMEIYAIADMLAQNIESAKEPGPICWLIAERANALNDELFELAQKIKGVNGVDKKTAEQFDDKHFILLRGIVVTARNLFREIHEPGPDAKQVNEDLSCALLGMVDNLDSALQEQGGD